jgi:diguanylate cyclase (GGDEF)-like protein
MRVAVTLVVVSILSAVFISVIAGQHRQLQEQALTDPLTGLSNRILLIDVLDQAVEQSRLSGAYITLLAIDLDHFKGINDSMGHDAGDTVLRGFGELLRHRIRRSDRAFRLGGEEFLLLVYGTDPDNGRRFAEELREEVESVTLLPDRQVTVSIGVATLRPEENWRDWMKRADENLYRAKSAGRNRIVA